jgi:hypothetical protein
MAISYTYLFDSIRQYIMLVNALDGWTEVYTDAEEAIEAELATAGRFDEISGVPEAFVQRRDTLVSTIQTLGSEISNLLANKGLCRGFLPITNTTSPSTILPALFNKMIADTQTLVAGSVTVGSVTPNGANNGDATLLVDGILDGASTPLSGGMSIKDYALDATGKWPGTSGYAGRGSELSAADSYTVICNRDSQTDRATEGSESFAILGSDAARQAYDWRGDGAGSGSVNMANGSNKLANGEFEIWTTDTGVDTLSSWTYGAGAVASATVGTIFKETSSVQRGLYALQIKGLTATAAIGLSQAQTNLTPLKRYLVACWVKTSGAGVAAGTLTIKFTGTGYTAGTTESISLNYTTLASLTSYTLKSFWVNMPESIPSDMALSILVTSSLSNGEKIYIDGMVLAEGQWFNGLCWGMVAGAYPAIRDDSYTFAVTTTEGGVQSFFRRYYKMQLPSLTAASTITDTVTAFS